MTDESPAGTTGPIARVLWMAAGFVSVAIGSIGIVIPGLPTTVFFIVAAWCFSHGSPRFERWVLDLPRIGPMVRDYRAGLGMPRRAKVVAITMMWVAIALSSYLLRDNGWLVAGVVALGVVGTVYLVWRVPTREAVAAARSI
ncbi:MAG TPA: YbaN family protein [Ilumatobacteraceae bacterium]|nr:YbaN family protein [Ilumatobacteraceae bacterium]